MPSSGASLLLNAEGVFTALLARSAFKENFDHRIARGMIAIMAGALTLSWPADARCAGLRPANSTMLNTATTSVSDRNSLKGNWRLLGDNPLITRNPIG